MIKIRLVFLVIPVLLMGNLSMAYAQQHPTIRTGRPGQSIGAYVVGSGFLQFQQGIDWQRTSTLDSNSMNLSNENVVRMGINERLELSAVLGLQTGDIPSTDGKRIGIQMNPLALGFRVHVLDQKGMLPALGFQARVSIGNGKSSGFPSRLGGKWVLVAAYNLGHGFGVAANLYLTWPGYGAETRAGYVVNVGFPVVGGLSGFVEHYASVEAGRLMPKVDAGLALSVHPDVQIDAYGGVTSLGAQTAGFASVGVSWRLQTQKP